MNTKKALVTAVLAALSLGASATPDRAVEQLEGKPFRLVYHSDSRGYYKPCG